MPHPSTSKRSIRHSADPSRLDEMLFAILIVNNLQAPKHIRIQNDELEMWNTTLPAEQPYSHSAHARSQCATHLLTKTIISALSARKKTRGMQKGIQEGARPYRGREHSIYAPHCCNTVSAACCREPGPGDRDPAGAWGRCGDFSSWACSIERSRWGFRVDERRWVEIGTVVGKVLGEQDRCGRHGRLTLYAFEYGFKWPRSWVFHSPS